MQALRHRLGHDGEQGQTAVLAVLFLTVMLGMAVLVMDGGNFQAKRRDLQGVADAAATAAVRELPASSTNADAVARDFVTSKNSGDGASVGNVTVTTNGTGTCTVDGTTVTLRPMSVCVTVTRDQPASFNGIAGVGTTTIKASAIAQAAQVNALTGWLPFGIRNGMYSSGTPQQVVITPGDQSSNVGGMINTPYGPTCAFSGGALIGDVIAGAANGGGDACPIDIGQQINTQTGVVNGKIQAGFDARLGTNSAMNHDAFNDVFGIDSTGKYYVKKPSSPRLGVIPIADDASGNWPLTSGAQISVHGYVLVYIGRTTSPDSKSLCAAPAYCPAVIGNGNGNNQLSIDFTPVNAPLPDSWLASIGDYSVTNPSPVVYRMTS
jgi:Flp pilus assembly protein TadG